MADELRKTKSTAEKPTRRQRPGMPRSISTPQNDHGLHRLFSAQFMDDHYHYHPEDRDGRRNSVATLTSPTNSNFSEADTATEEKREKPEGYDGDDQDDEPQEDEEVRGGILNLHDRDEESRPSKMERMKSSKSAKDPNLVRSM